MHLTNTKVEIIGRAILAYNDQKITIAELEQKIINALGIPWPSIILKVDPSKTDKETMAQLKKAWTEIMQRVDANAVQAISPFNQEGINTTEDENSRN